MPRRCFGVTNNSSRRYGGALNEAWRATLIEGFARVPLKLSHVETSKSPMSSRGSKDSIDLDSDVINPFRLRLRKHVLTVIELARYLFPSLSRRAALPASAYRISMCKIDAASWQLFSPSLFLVYGKVGEHMNNSLI